MTKNKELEILRVPPLLRIHPCSRMQTPYVARWLRAVWEHNPCSIPCYLEGKDSLLVVTLPVPHIIMSLTLIIYKEECPLYDQLPYLNHSCIDYILTKPAFSW